MRAPTDAASLLSFLDGLAKSADTAVVQSFRGRATRLPAPAVGRAVAPAFELLAQGLHGLPVAFERTQRGEWALFEHGDPSSRGCFAAAGGTFLRLDNQGVYRRDGKLWGMGRLYFDLVDPDVAVVDTVAQVINARDDRHRKTAAVASGDPRWISERQVSFVLDDP